MKVQVDNLAKQALIDIYYYIYQYSIRNAIETTKKIRIIIHDLEHSPYMGRQIPEMSNKSFREIIYTNSRNLRYRIMYYISERTDTIYIFNIISSKQDFYRNLKLHNYFNKYLKF